MSTRSTRLWLITAMMLTSCLTSAKADDWYAGMEVGPNDLVFQPRYQNLGTGNQSGFHDPAEGTEVGVVGGRRLDICDRFDLGLQARVGFTGSSFDLVTGEPATIHYETPWSLTVSAVPQYHVWGPVSLFGELGLGGGEVDERKISATTSNYDVSPFEFVTTLGGGLKVEVSQHVEVYAMYRDTRYSSFAYTTYLTTGTPVESVTDKPRADAYMFGGLWHF